MSLLLAALGGYLLGAIPFGLIIGRLTKGIDLREYGSHRTGATNALRTLGTRAAAAVFALDVAKGVAAVLLARLVFAGDPMVEWAAALAGLAAIVGHNWSAFIGFTGGRGVATSAGALGAMSVWTIFILAPIVAVVICERATCRSARSSARSARLSSPPCWRRSAGPRSPPSPTRRPRGCW